MGPGHQFGRAPARLLDIERGRPSGRLEIGEPLDEAVEQAGVGAVVESRSPALGGGAHGQEHRRAARRVHDVAREPGHVPDPTGDPASAGAFEPARVLETAGGLERVGVGEQVGPQLDDVGPGSGGGARLRQAGRGVGPRGGDGDGDAPVGRQQSAHRDPSAGSPTGRTRDRAMPSRMSCRLVTVCASRCPRAAVSSTTRAMTSDHTRAPAAMTSRRPGRR